MGGHVQVAISTMASAAPQVKAAKMRALAVTTAKRVALFPDVPTMHEAGVSGYEFNTWYGLLAPARTPRTVIDRLNGEAARILSSTALQEQLSAQGLEAAPTSPEEFGAYMRAQFEEYSRVIQEANITVK